MVFSSEVPTEAPSCWPTVTVAEATPASCGATPNVPVLIAGAITMPTPVPGAADRGGMGHETHNLISLFFFVIADVAGNAASRGCHGGAIALATGSRMGP